MWPGGCLLEPLGTWEQGLLRPLLVAGHPCCLLFVCHHRMVTRSLCLCALISMFYGTSHWRRAHPVITSLKSLFASKVWAAVNLGGRHSARFRRPPPAGHTALPSGPLVAVSRGPLRALSLGQQPRAAAAASRTWRLARCCFCLFFACFADFFITLPSFPART